MFSKKTMNSFSIKYDVDPDTSCWNWNASTARGGYGQFNTSVLDGRRWYRAHRFSYEAHKGSIPEGLVVRHLCDNPACVNPDHLETGTQADNIADRDRRGRGCYCGNRRIDLKIDFAEVIASDESDLAIARRLGCSRGHIWKIRKGRYASQK